MILLLPVCIQYFMLLSYFTVLILKILPNIVPTIGFLMYFTIVFRVNCQDLGLDIGKVLTCRVTCVYSHTPHP
jgi:hypothetical protein